MKPVLALLADEPGNFAWKMAEGVAIHPHLLCAAALKLQSIAQQLLERGATEASGSIEIPNGVVKDNLARKMPEKPR